MLAVGVLLGLLAACGADGDVGDQAAPAQPPPIPVAGRTELSTSPPVTSQVQAGDAGAKTDVDVRVDRILTELEATTTPEGAVITLDERVLFDFGEADIKPEAALPIEQIAELIRLNPSAPVSIRGHTDSVGSDSFNDDLFRRRAQAVLAQLVDTHGIDSARLVAEGLGKRQPVVPNMRPDGSDDPDGREKN